eukprot:jgi/Pico_ML_1/53875/g4344.t1
MPTVVASPLEQFALLSLVPLHLGPLYLSFTNAALFMVVAAGVTWGLGRAVTLRGGALVPGPWQGGVEMVYEFVRNLVEEQLHGDHHFVVTFGLSLSLFVGITAVGFQQHGWHFFSFLLPKGAPLVLAPLLVVLELVSYCFRAVAVAVLQAYVFTILTCIYLNDAIHLH